MRVLVAGGGVAGVAAAISASSVGAEVTLVERSRVVGFSRAALPLLLDGRASVNELVLPDAKELESARSVELRTGESVVAVRERERLLETSERTIRYDSLVVATGSSPQTEALKGSTKERAFVMEGLDDYLKLRDSFDAISSVAVLGSGLSALSASEVLIGKGKRVALFTGRDGWPPRQLSSSLGGRVASAVEAGGVSVIKSRFQTVAGVKGVEAVVAEGRVYPCDAAVVFPVFSPNVPRTSCDLGVHGGIMVDASMRTSVPGILSAGDCAEVRLGSSSQQFQLRSSARLMGEVAGRNAAGGSSSARLSGTVAQRVFGVEVCLSGVTVAEARAAGLDAVEVQNSVSPRRGESRSSEVNVSMVYDRGTHDVYGLQLAGEGVILLAELASVVVSTRLRLEELLTIEAPSLPGSSMDRSPIALTAGRGLGLERT
jgi:NADPH-dependent 2,4-dienoyl-CoA reductase/sulfur reductase-like enzyme